MSKLFNQTTFNKVGKSLIDLSHEKKLTMQMGDLVPIFLAETVPGDKFRINTETLIRLAPMVAPVMHRCNAYLHFFKIPNRLLFDKWETFITGGADGKQTAVMPYITQKATDEPYFAKGSLADYMGIPVTDPAVPLVNGADLNLLPFRAYQLIYNEYYRDQNLSQPVGITKNEGLILGQEMIDTIQLRKRSWEKDYFTSAMPWSQRGDEILLPVTSADEASKVYMTPGHGVPADGPLLVEEGKLTVVPTFVNIENPIQITINDLRRSARLQEFLEKTARGGSRLTEVVRAFFGVKSSDARLQRPEFIGGSRQPITISEVLATFDSAETAGATMYGHGMSIGNSKYINTFCEEHGWIIGIMSVMPRTAYQQGVPKLFRKFDKFDLYWPTFAQLGEQPVEDMELYMDYYGAGWQNNTFGYQSRYSEYKQIQSSVHGDFKDNLNYWHMGRIFDSKPALNEAFVTSDPTQRIFAVTDTDVHKLWVQLYNDVRAIRPMPYFNNPIL
jgi:hypothetical protein